MHQSEHEPNLARWERRLSGVGAGVPYLLLAAATLIAGLTGGVATPGWPGTLALVGLTAGWMLWLVTLHPAWAMRRRMMALYYGGLLVLIGLLLTRSLWFSLFAFTGYLHAWQFLHGRWRFLGVAATALLATTWQVSGRASLDGAALITYLVVVVITVVLVSLFSAFGELTATQSRQRQQMIAELAETNRRLEAALRENAALQAQVIARARDAGVQDERQRLAAELHDTLAQGLAGIITQLEASQQAAQHPAQRQHHLESALALARHSLTEARRAMQALQPASLEYAPLPAAIATLAQDWTKATQIPAQVTVTGSARPLLAELEATLYRVAQEALTNVARHACASRVALTLSYMEDLVVLDIRDDGIGFEPGHGRTTAAAGAGHGLGLPGMAQRLQRVAGSLTIESAPGRGTAISASVPAIAAVEERGAL